MTEIYIFSQHEDKLLTALTEETGLIQAPFREELNGLSDRPFSFAVDATSEEAKHVIEENQVVFRDKEGELRLYVIKEVEDVGGDVSETTALCEPAFMELKEHVVVDRRFVDQTAQRALDAALEGTRWTGRVEIELGQATTNFYYITSVDAIWKIMNVWGGEFKDVVEFDGNRITSRRIRILARRGVDDGKRFEIGHNTEEIQRTVLSYPFTALYGRGASLPIEDEDGEHTGGYTRYIDFADVVWRKANGDPVDKPRGQKWVGDPDALQQYGREHEGKLLHREGIYENGDYEDPAELLKATWEQLQKAKKPEVTYRLSVHLLESLAGYEHERVSLGDTARAIDRNFSRPIEIQARVIAIEYDLLDIDGTATVEMGQFLSVYEYDDRLDKVVREVNDNKRKWDTGGGPIGPDKYPDIVPDVPIVTATGLFAMVQLEWDYDYVKTYVAAYEVYASEVKGFVPSPETLVYKGIANSFSFSGEVNRQYYFRVRAVNYHGRASNYSVEVTAMTARIISDDILFGEELAERLRELHKEADIIGRDGIDLDQISEEARERLKEAAKQYTDEEIKAVTDQINSELADKAGLEYVNGKFQFTDGKLAELDSIADDLQREVGDISGTVSDIATNIDAIEGELSVTARRLTNMDGKLSSQEAEIRANAEAIAARVTKDQFDSTTGNLSRQIGQLEFTANGLRTDFSELSKTVEGITVGVRNLARLDVVTPWGQAFKENNYVYHIDTPSEGGMRIDASIFEAGKEYVLSFKIRKISGAITSLAGHSNGFETIGVYRDGKLVSRDWLKGNEANPYPDDTATHEYVVYLKFTKPDADNPNLYIQPNRSTYGTAYVAEIWDLKVEEGNKKTGWEPAPEDTQEALTVISDKQASFESTINGLKADVSNVETRVDKNTGDITNVTSRTSQLELRADRFSTTIAELSHAATTGDNIIPDGSFEGGGLGWHGPGEIVDDAYSGKKALEFKGVSSPATRSQSVTKPVAVVPGHTYRISYWYKTSADANGTSNNQKFRFGNADTGALVKDWGWSGAKTEWTQIKGTWKCPENVKALSVSMVTNHTVGWVRVDDFEVVDITEVSSLQTSIDQNARQISLVASDTSVLGGRMSQAESRLSVQADQINARVEKDGVIAAINISSEGVRIDGAKTRITGQTLIDNGVIKSAHIGEAAVGTAAIANASITKAKLQNAIIGTAQIENGAITNAKIGNGQIDNAKIANATITNAKISDISAAKITSGTLDAANIMVRAMNGRMAVQIDADGFKAFDSNARNRILIGIRNFNGVGSDPAVVRFFDPGGKNMGYIGANTNDTFSLYSTSYTFWASDDRVVMSSNEFRFDPMRGSSGSRYWVMGRNETSSKEGLHPAFKPDTSGWGLVGRSNARLWEVWTNNMHYVTMHKISSRNAKENIEPLDLDYFASLIDQVELMSYHYKTPEKDGAFVRPNYGPISEDLPEEFRTPTDEGPALSMDDFIAGILAKVKVQDREIKSLQEQIKEIKGA
ncbi:phage tail spike protein [Shouchella rhizosphaerae]|uniref:phage tail spike protein n=1 Tax=Shouchella rhizosphaerae TaxID=866786 RepID=UPI003F803DF6